MNIEAKLILNNLKKKKRRMTFSLISITLCASLIFSTMLMISSVQNGISENFKTMNKDYHFIVKNLPSNCYEQIKDKEYIEKIYIMESMQGMLKEISSSSELTKDNTTIYIKYKDIKKTCQYSNDIISSLEYSNEFRKLKDNFDFNQELLTVYGLIDANIMEDLRCVVRLNYSYVIDLMIIVILIAFSVLFIVILYNAFLITINERRKEYAILNSIGGTENQILKMIFLEAFFLGILGIILGAFIALGIVSIFLKMLNQILVETGYCFELFLNMKYIILALGIIIINIYISAIIPSMKASSTSVMQDIRNNKQINIKRRKNFLENFCPIEGKLAIKNIKRNRNKYRLITFLMIICMTIYISTTTYLKYEKAVADLVVEYDTDAELTVDLTSGIDYQTILKDYMLKTGDKVETLEYKTMNINVLIEPVDAIMTDTLVLSYADNRKSKEMILIGLEDKAYNKYLHSTNAQEGDIIIYNNVTTISGREKINYSHSQLFKTNCKLNLSIIDTQYDYENEIWKYKPIDTENLGESIFLTNKLLDGFLEIKTLNGASAVFTNMKKYEEIEQKIANYMQSVKKVSPLNQQLYIKVNCKNIIELSNYLKNIHEKQNLEFGADFYSLENKEKLIYINVIEFILKIIMFTVILLGIVSSINIINASLCERNEEFKMLYRLGATSGNVNKILIYESFYMFVKAMIIAIILSIPFVYGTIDYMSNVIELDKLLIPFKEIGIFLFSIYAISLIVTLGSARTIKNEQ